MTRPAAVLPEYGTLRYSTTVPPSTAIRIQYNTVRVQYMGAMRHVPIRMSPTRDKPSHQRQMFVVESRQDSRSPFHHLFVFVYVSCYVLLRTLGLILASWHQGLVSCDHQMVAYRYSTLPYSNLLLTLIRVLVRYVSDLFNVTITVVLVRYKQGVDGTVQYTRTVQAGSTPWALVPYK